MIYKMLRWKLLKIEQHEPHLNGGGGVEDRGSGRVSSSCPISDTRYAIVKWNDSVFSR